MRAKCRCKAILQKYRKMAATHSSKWFKLSSNKEADERGSRASISVEGLRQSPDDPASTRLRDMVVIARDFYHTLHTPIPASNVRLNAQTALIDEVSCDYGPLAGPSNAVSPSGPFSYGEVISLKKKMPNSAPGPDGIQYPFWKALTACIDQMCSNGSPIPSFWEVFRDLTDNLRAHGTNRLGFKDARQPEPFL